MAPCHGATSIIGFDTDENKPSNVWYKGLTSHFYLFYSPVSTGNARELQQTNNRKAELMAMVDIESVEIGGEVLPNWSFK